MDLHFLLIGLFLHIASSGTGSECTIIHRDINLHLNDSNALKLETTGVLTPRLMRIRFVNKNRFFKQNKWSILSSENRDFSNHVDKLKLRTQEASQKKRSCTSPKLVPTKPFSVFWNVPSFVCDRGIPFNFTGSGITHNAKDAFIGDEDAIFYNLGLFPRLGNPNVNGGIPQLGDLAKHLVLVESNILKLLPNPMFHGAGIIDMESWRPIWITNFSSLRKYQTASINLVKQQHPSWTNNTQINNEAEKQFEASARSFMLRSIEKVRELRPQGYYGYYGYPRCWGRPTAKDTTCPIGITSQVNDKLGWLFSASNALYPRIYFDPVAGSPDPIHNAIRRILNETARVQAKFSGLDAPILPYAIFQTGLHFFNETDLDLAIREPADMGAAGVVFWGSSAMFHIPNECAKMNNYIQHVLGPYISKTEKFFENCTQVNCNGHGRCIRKDYFQMAQDNLREGDHCKLSKEEMAEIINVKSDSNEFEVSYACRCFDGWKGSKCLMSES